MMMIIKFNHTIENFTSEKVNFSTMLLKSMCRTEQGSKNKTRPDSGRMESQQACPRDPDSPPLLPLGDAT